MKKILFSLALFVNLTLLNAQNPIVQDTVKKETEDLEEILIQSTRTSRTIRNTPSRVETIDEEELEEKANMKPANVTMVLHESTGITVQQTSATSGNASIRVQGLDGRYTQLLKDGYANFGNFASGLSILEIPPLDLQQVEIIKGPASTLYGGGAIAGVVNFISKIPREKAENNFLVNQSHIGQTNIGGYSSLKKGKLGYTFLALANFQNDYDVDRDGFSELPESKSFTINPRFFYYPDAQTTIQLGNSFTKGDSKGGDTSVLHGKPGGGHVYFERNQTLRNTTVLELDRKLQNGNRFTFKQSLSLFDRKIAIPDYGFSGFNTNSFTDVSYVWNLKQHTVIGGLNFIYDGFNDRENTGNSLDNRTVTAGIYLQDTWDISDKVKLESGLRVDQVRFKNTNFNKTQAFVLPRISALYRVSEAISTRIGGGLGYKTPTVFTEQTETIQYQNVLPLDQVKAEKSIGATADLNYRTRLGAELSFSANQMFFLTSISDPLVLQNDGLGRFFFSNQARPVTSSGFETNLKFIFREDFKLFAGYTFIDAKAKYLETDRFLPLLPKHKLNLALLYEKERNFKLGLEGYFTGRQFLYDRSATPSFWEFGFSAEKTFNKVTFFVNFENFTDEKQSNYKAVANGPVDKPTFDDIWNHTEGFVFNGGIKLKL